MSTLPNPTDETQVQFLISKVFDLMNALHESQSLCLALAERCAKQSELLSKRAEKDSLNLKIEQLKEMFNEVAFGWNDSGDFWTIHFGPRGSGSMIEGIGDYFSTGNDDTLEELVDQLIEQRGLLAEKQRGERECGD